MKEEGKPYLYDADTTQAIVNVLGDCVDKCYIVGEYVNGEPVIPQKYIDAKNPQALTLDAEIIMKMADGRMVSLYGYSFHGRDMLDISIAFDRLYHEVALMRKDADT